MVAIFDLVSPNSPRATSNSDSFCSSAATVLTKLDVVRLSSSVVVSRLNVVRLSSSVVAPNATESSLT